MDNADKSNALNAFTKWRHSLSFRLFALAIVSVLIVEALIFIPSATRFRNDWIADQVEASKLALLALDAAPSRMVSDSLEKELLESAMVHSVGAIIPLEERREIILSPSKPICCTPKRVTFNEDPGFAEISATLNTFFAPRDRFLIIEAADWSDPAQPRILEIVVKEDMLRRGMERYALNILGLSLLISMVTGGLIYLMLLLTVVRPIRRVTDSVERFRDDPGGWTRRLSPTHRKDEIGRAQNALSDMETAVSDSFRQRERLAELGEAVAKINHDLRNSLATAQLVSDGLSRSEDPRVAKSLPRLERALQRAINLASDTLKYGKSSIPEAAAQSVRLFDIVEEAAAEALAARSDITFVNQVGLTDTRLLDPDHLHRICANLIRNAAEAMTGGGEIEVSATQDALMVSDTGPGLPAQAREHLFKPFVGSTRRDGTGLGLALSKDLAKAMGADLVLHKSDENGTVFSLMFDGRSDQKG